MKYQINLVVILVALVLFACNNNAQKQVNLVTSIDSVSYAIGADYANYVVGQFKSNDMDSVLVKDLFVRGFSDVVNSGELKISKEDGQKIVQGFFEKKQQEQVEKMKKQHEPTRLQGESFLEKNKTEEGVVTLPSGLQYKIVKKGNGAIPAATDKVTVNYHGTFIDGTVFDSSVERNQPATFGVNQVIPGWTEILQIMPVGSLWKVYVPYQLAYGDRGSGQRIPPYSCLIFDVELLSINK